MPTIPELEAEIKAIDDKIIELHRQEREYEKEQHALVQQIRNQMFAWKVVRYYRNDNGEAETQWRATEQAAQESLDELVRSIQSAWGCTANEENGVWYFTGSRQYRDSYARIERNVDYVGEANV